MKKHILLTILLIGLLFLPIAVNASEKYNHLDLEEALKEENIEIEFSDYKPSSDAITIYLFRGEGCGYCRAFLTFLNSIADEYGKYFKLESYEVWNDEANGDLMTKVSEYLENPASGVPYIIIGDKVFAGYASDYDEDIKAAITDLYNTKKSSRYDVFEQMKKNPKKDKTTSSGSTSTLLWIFAMIFVSTGIIISYINIKFKELYEKINSKETLKKK